MDRETTTLWNYYNEGRAYQGSIGITKQVPINVDFFEGRQWAAPTANTRHLPRPVVNIVKMIVRNKKAGIAGQKIKLNFLSFFEKERSDRITAFNEYIEREMEAEKVNDKWLLDAIVKGSGFKHYYWDADATGMRSEYTGGVRVETIDILNIFFDNPQETDEQKQKWILIASRIDVNAAKAMADDGVDKTLILPDDNANAHYSDEHEQGKNKLCTVLTRYFRINGEVYYERGTKSVMLHKPRALNPEVVEVELKEDDAAESELPDEPITKEQGYKARLYPIVAYNYEAREKSIYGLSEVEGIIPNQKAINFNIAMQLLALQNQSWGKFIVKPNALLGQTITNEPGQVLIDHSPTGVDGIKRLSEQSLSNAPMQLVDNIISITRMATGSTEVVTGEQVSPNQSGAAIAQLQSQALKPVEDLRKAYWRASERGGRILEQFYKLFYENKHFDYMDDETPVSDIFNGEEYQQTDFSITVEACSGSQFSESLMITTLENMLANQHIDLATYIELYPETAMPFKASLKKQIKLREESENAQLRQMAAQYEQQLQQMAAHIKQNKAIVSQAANVIGQLNTITEQNEALKVEGAAKIIAQNQALQQLAAQNTQTTRDAQALAALAAQK